MPVTELDDETRALITLSCVPGIGSTLLTKALAHFGSGLETLRATERDLVRAGLSPAIAVEVRRAVAEGLPDLEERLLAGSDVAFLRIGDEDYPPLLRHTYNAPPLLYLRGSLGVSDLTSVTIVGSRRASEAARDKAYELARDLAARGVTVVSGFALGVDTAAHEGALDGAGRTVAVMGCGLSHVYPPENEALAERVTSAGALLSEFPMSVPPIAGNFPRRNRVMSGLTLATIVIEAPARSGALKTADYALEQGGKEVFAVPWRQTSFLNAGSQRLLSEGATPCESAEDVFAVISEMTKPGTFAARQRSTRTVGGTHSAGKAVQPASAVAEPSPDLGADERLVWEALTYEPTHIDALTQLTGLTPGRASAALLLLEMKTLVRQYPGKRFARKGSSTR
ncbi:DNA-protecting protein DprA [Candidatus Poribacteria bacterium]|nr:DNA-protecting protein DprA [Candidatus Poribacteria bacterium]